ncbi:glycosyltransferase family 1 protein [Durotheca rogersii]|uniref:glycosyltransferase family 1 protein n=1 Tax=Durotheca rogersii TaxID=419775 RepID=UPI00221ED0C7|nr:glycosyltransferase family 1 protein [Durotheca rogersii]KAI5865792.1 glycosyltransferase family 1 protein [Durotheca rogersii]
MAIVDEKKQAADEPAPAPRRPTSSDAPEVVVHEGYNTGLIPEDPQLVVEEDVPPAYSELHDQLSLHQAGFDAGAAVTEDGRVNININQTTPHLADIIAPTLRNQLRESVSASAESPLPPPYIPPSLGGEPGQKPPPQLNVVIQIVGSRGDVQPFVALGQVLKNTYGHRVRVATHTTFQKFVEENGLEFFNIGGDPAELMAFMVKNPGLMPGIDALKSGEITKRRKGIEEIVLGCWRSCIETGDGLGPAPRFDRRRGDDADEEPPTPPEELGGHRAFVADAIIANPPSFAHIHVAEKLGVPLHLMFTMPWSPTRAFPQPLANIQSSNTDPVTTNYVSYALVEMMTWQGLGDVINRFRTKVLDLEPLSLMWAPAVLTRLRIPYTYCWSPALIPKPNDWGQHIDIAGFYFLNLASSYTPEPELAAFLAAGPPPVYIGFGSIVVDDPNELTRTIFDAVAETGVRALVSKGWGGLGADAVGMPDNIFMLGNVPHDWLFQHVAAVCHHGGAGTTAAGISAGKPTIVVPFFGDQPFWGAMVARAGAGPDPIPYKRLTPATLAEAIRVALKPETQQRAHELGERIREEKGTHVGAQSFHRHLDYEKLRCSLAPSRVAVWRVRRSKVRLSGLAAATLVDNGYLKYSDLKLFRAKEYSTEDHPTDPISATTSALLGDMGSIAMSITDFPRDIFKAAKGPGSVPSEKPGDDSATVVSSEDGNLNPLTQTNSIATSTTTVSTTNAARRPLSQIGMTTPNSSAPSLAPLASIASERSRSPSVPPPTPRHQHSNSTSRPGTTSPNAGSRNLERALGAGKSINNIVATGMKSPMHFCLGLARGFRNVPTLYNDDTVRPLEKVTDFTSGLKVAGKEFGFGLYDGITGLVTQPIRGAEKDGGIGLLKGFGRGIGGLVLKPAAAMWSIPAYTMAGVHAEIRSLFAQSAHKYIVASRISQGRRDLADSSAGERQDIEARWFTEKKNLKGFYAFKQRQKGKSRDVSPAPPENGSATPERTSSDEPARTSWLPIRAAPFDGQMRGWKRKRAEAAATGGTHVGEMLPTAPSTDSLRAQDEEFEQAIQAAVRETSRGDATEDARVEQAIRSSVGVLRRRSTTMSSFASSSSQISTGQGHGYPIDVKHPLPGDNPPPQLPPRIPDNLMDITDEEYAALIEQAVQLSMAEHYQNQQKGIIRHDDTSEDEDFKLALERSQTERSSGDQDEDEEYKKALQISEAEQKNSDGLDEDEELRKAIEASQAEKSLPHAASKEEEELLRRAIEESERVHREELVRVSSMKTEEEIVMEYVKRQSIIEEEYRKAAAAAALTGKQQNEVGDGDEDEDEQLRRALEESLQTGQGGGSGGGPSRI